MKNRKKLTGARAVGLLRYLPLILWVAFFVFAQQDHLENSQEFEK